VFIGQFRFVVLGSWKAGGGGAGEKKVYCFHFYCILLLIVPTCLLSGFFLTEFFIFSVISRALIFGFIVTRKYIIPQYIFFANAQ